MIIPVNLGKYLAKCTYTSKMLDSLIERPIVWGVSKLKDIHDKFFKKLFLKKENIKGLCLILL